MLDLNRSHGTNRHNTTDLDNGQPQKVPPQPERYWFPARRLGWGWGLPVTWEGWVCVGTFVVLQLGAFFPLLIYLPLYCELAYAFAISAFFVAIMWWKGEPPRWRGWYAETPPRQAKRPGNDSA